MKKRPSTTQRRLVLEEVSVRRDLDSSSTCPWSRSNLRLRVDDTVEDAEAFVRPSSPPRDPLRAGRSAV